MAELAREPLIEFGDHSYEHPHMSRLPAARIEAEIDQTAAALAKYGKRAVAFRPPFGEWSSRLIDVVQAKQLPTVTWDIVSGDPSARTTAAGMITVVSKARPGSIVVFHINGRGHKTAEALPVIVRELRERGFRFVQVSELIASHAGAPNLVHVELPATTTTAAPGTRDGALGWAGAGAFAVVRASPAVARSQAAWIVAIEPWRGLGYREAALGRYLARQARAGDVWVARARAADACGAAARRGVVVATDGFLLGGFIALLAVKPDASGQGLGAALVAHVEARLRRGGVGFSRLATLATAPRCVSTAGWASDRSAGSPIS